MNPAGTVSAGCLREFCLAVLSKAGLSEPNAITLTDSLLFADLRGVPSHGIARLAEYIQRVNAGAMELDPKMDLEQDHPASALLNARNGLGQVAGATAMALAIEKGENWRGWRSWSQELQSLWHCCLLCHESARAGYDRLGFYQCGSVHGSLWHEGGFARNESNLRCHSRGNATANCAGYVHFRCGPRKNLARRAGGPENTAGLGLGQRRRAYGGSQGGPGRRNPGADRRAQRFGLIAGDRYSLRGFDRHDHYRRREADRRFLRPHEYHPFVDGHQCGVLRKPRAIQTKRRRGNSAD